MKFDLTNPMFHDEAKAREYLESLHWPDGPVCPRCESMRVTKHGRHHGASRHLYLQRLSPPVYGHSPHHL